jgi:uncharacterized protein YjbI with pentapeptide repeats
VGAERVAAGALDRAEAMKQGKKFVFSRQEPDLPEELDAATGFPDQREIFVAEQSITGAELKNRTGGNLRVESAVLERVNLGDSSFGTIVLKDVRLVSCELANLRARAMTLVRVEFIDCRMTGLSGGDVDAQDLLIRDGDQRYCQFRSSKFKSAEFDGCNFEDGDFQDTDFTGAIFRRCNLRNVEMGKARLQDADLRGSTVEALHIELEGLRGAIVDPAQAMSFALLMGIRIE